MSNICITIAASAAVLLSLSSCDQSPPAEIRAITDPSHQEAQAAAGIPWFEDVTEASGIDFVHRSGHSGRFLMPEVITGGGALLDYDNDSDLDVFLVQAGSLTGTGANAETSQLYRNRGDGTFENVTARSGAGVRGYGVGAAVGDYNNDGFIDIYITNYGANTLLKNNGNGTFTNVTESAGVGHTGWGTSAVFFDFDKDGHLDLFATNYLNWSVATELDCYNTMSAKDYCSPQSYNAPACDVLYRNNGDGTFTDVTESAGISAVFGTGLGVVAADFNGDGWLDLFVANDGMKNQLWANRGNGTFIDIALRVGCAVDLDGIEKAGMGIAVADVDDDADLDLLVCNLAQQSDSLYRNDAGYFSDTTAIAKLGTVSRPFTRFGMAWHDFNHDGLLDLYQVNGRVMQQAQLYTNDPYAEPNLLFKGIGPVKFEEVLPRGGTEAIIAATGRAGLFGDLDNDGDIDIIVVNRDGPVHVLRNIAPKQGKAITFRLEDEQGRVVTHAAVSVNASGRRIYREARSDYSYLAANDPRVHCGLAAQERATGIIVRWPNGQLESFPDQPIDQIVTLRRGAGTPAAAPAPAVSPAR